MTSGFLIMNQSTKIPNFFQIIYHSIKDLIKAGEHDVATVNGKIKSCFSHLSRTKMTHPHVVKSIMRILLLKKSASYCVS